MNIIALQYFFKARAINPNHNVGKLHVQGRTVVPLIVNGILNVCMVQRSTTDWCTQMHCSTFIFGVIRPLRHEK